MPGDVYPENQRLVTWMQSKGLNASQLADRLGTSRATISHVVNGRNKLSLTLAQSLTREFPDFDLYYVVMGNSKEYPSRVQDAAGSVPTSYQTGIETIILIEGDHFEIKTRRPLL